MMTNLLILTALGVSAGVFIVLMVFFRDEMTKEEIMDTWMVMTFIITGCTIILYVIAGTLGIL